MLFVLALLVKRILPLAILAGIVGGGIWAWREAHASVPASLGSALDEVRAAKLRSGAAALPLAGVYHYQAAGDETLAIGPLEIERALPEESLLVVLPEARGARSLEWRFARDSAERWHLSASGRGANMVYRSGTVGVRRFARDYGGQTVSALWRPAQPRVGMKWNATYQAGADLAFQRSSTVVRQETLTVGGQRVRTWVIDARELVTGAIDGEARERIWWSPELQLDVKRRIERHLGGTVSHDLNATLTLSSIAPDR
jgi:hypothetical protein